MTYEQLRAYLTGGGTDQQYVLESIEKNTSDETARELIRVLFENVEAE